MGTNHAGETRECVGMIAAGPRGPRVKGSILLKTRRDVTTFLTGFPNLDEPVTWTCPECGAVNPDAYHSHETRCINCDKGYFPRLHLPIKGDPKQSVKEAILSQKIEEIKDEIKQYQDDIDGFEAEIDDRQEWIYNLRENLKNYERELKGDKRGDSK